jgi:hypothetical protein
MEVTLLVTVQVDSCDEDSFPSDEDAVRNSVQEGVWNSLKQSNNMGFSHSMADEICMCVTHIEVKDEQD